MIGRSLIYKLVLLLALSAGANGAAGGEAPHVPARWDMASFERVVRPMQHDARGRLPLFVWWLPTPQADNLPVTRADGTLRRCIDALAARGTVATVQVGGQSLADSLAMAVTLQEARQPVYLVFPKPDVMESTAWQHTKVVAPGIDLDGRTQRQYPCLPLADGKSGAEWMRQQLMPFKQAGIRVSGVWFDDERLPYPWVPTWHAQRDSPECRRHYPPGVLDDYEKFRQYVFALRAGLMSQIMADPVHQMFPGAITGNFNDFNSSAQSPFHDTYGIPFPPHDVGHLDAVMPPYYAGGVAMPQTKPGQPVTQEVADRTYLQMILATATDTAVNANGKLNIPYVGDVVPATQPLISRSAWKELMRHLWLRGANSMYLFGLTYPNWQADQTVPLNSIEDARSVYDELLAFRPFLDHGTPMNLSQPKLNDKEPLWSGLRLAGQCLVRTFSLDATPTRVTVSPFPGLRVTLQAPREGATWLIHRDGKVEQVG